MHEIQIDIWCLQQVQALLKALLCPGVEGAPKLAGDEKILSLHNAAGNDVLEGFADLVLILVAEGAVNVPVAALNGVDDSLLDLTRRRLPRSQAEGGDRGASVEWDCGVHVGLWMDDIFRSAFQHKTGQRRVHVGAGGLGVYVVGCRLLELHIVAATFSVLVAVQPLIDCFNSSDDRQRPARAAPPG